jgi:hypothetical protein
MTHQKHASTQYETFLSSRTRGRQRRPDNHRSQKMAEQNWSRQPKITGRKDYCVEFLQCTLCTSEEKNKIRGR